MDKQGFISYMEGKDLAPSTQAEYLLKMKLFLGWVGKEDVQVTKPDVLNYLEHLKNGRGLQNVSRSNHLIALNHYYTYLYTNGQIAKNPCLLLKIHGTNKKRLHKIYTPDELDRIFDSYYQLFIRSYDDSRYRDDAQRRYSALHRERNAVMLSVLIHQGTITNEIERIETGDLDLIKATIRIRGGKKLNERTLPLKATQIGLFMHYLQDIRPQLLEYQTKESGKLFLPLPAISQTKTDNERLRCAFKPFTEQVKSIDRQFFNFRQVRASVITFWIKTQGLRKAQHLAGHRSICTTEKYLTNNLDGLTDDINQLHPF